MLRLVEYLPVLGLTLAWLMPLHFLPWVTWHSEVPVFGAVLITATWAVAREIRIRGSTARIEVPNMALALLAIGLVAVFQAITGVIRFYGDGWIVLLYMLLCAASFLVGHAKAMQCAQGES